MAKPTATAIRYCVRDDEGRLMLGTLADSIAEAIGKLRSSRRSPLWSWYCRAGFRVVKVELAVAVIPGTHWPPVGFVEPTLDRGGERKGKAVR